MKKNPLQDIAKHPMYSVCSASEEVLVAAMEQARLGNHPVLIEATANQVNQFGGYTGMTPASFYKYVHDLAKMHGFPESDVLLGGDHLGPLVWQNLPEEEAMQRAEKLVYDFARAGYQKIHLDTSMRLGTDDPNLPLTDETIAQRAAKLAKAAQKGFVDFQKEVPDAAPPVFIIGSEVPIPGGAQDEAEELSVTAPSAMRGTVEAFRTIFAQNGLAGLWKQVVAVVVQPGVEFSDTRVDLYDPEKASALIQSLEEYPNLVFEGHSTDYQSKALLRKLVQDKVCVLKVGPAVTFGQREALFALCHIEKELLEGEPGVTLSNFIETLDAAMCEEPKNWAKYYHGSPKEQAFKRKYSFSDRCRYYLPNPKVTAAIAKLFENLSKVDIPLSLLFQFLPEQARRVRAGELKPEPVALVRDHIADYMRDYEYAIRPNAKIDK